MILADIKVNSNINQLWPNFEWYNGKSSMIHKMKYLVEMYKLEHNIKVINMIEILIDLNEIKVSTRS